MPKTRRLSDATLVRRSQQGDRRAFGALVNRYDRRLRGLAHALLLDGAQMDTAMGMAYLRAWRDVVRVQPRDDVGPWLYRAVYNACIDQLRRAEPPQDAADGDGLRGALASLAPADRVAVVLVEREGFTAASAARILGVSEDVLAARADLARERLGPSVPDTAAPATVPAEAEAATSGSGPNGEAGEQSPGADGAGTGPPAATSPAVASGDAPARAVDGEPGTSTDVAPPAAADAATDAAADAATDAATEAATDVATDVATDDDGPAGSGADGPADGEPAGDARDAGEGADAGPSREDSSEDAPADDPADAPAGATEPAGRTPDRRSTVPAEAPPDPDHEGVRVLQPVGSAAGSGNGSAAPSGGDAPSLPEGDAHIERTPDDLSEEIVIAEEDAAEARRAAVRQSR